MSEIQNLSAQQRSTVWNALRVAAERFNEDAKTARESDLPSEAKERLAKQFEKQAAESRELLEVFE